MRFSFVLLIGILASFGSSAAELKLYSTQCTATSIVIEVKSGEKWMLQNTYSGGLAKWIEEKESFSLNFSDMASNLTTPILSYRYSRSQTEMIDEKVTRIQGQTWMTAILDGKIENLERSYTKTKTKVNEFDSTVSTVAKNEKAQESKMTERDLGKGKFLSVVTQENLESPAQDLRIDSEVVNCVDELIDAKKAKSLFSPEIWKAIIQVDALMVAATKSEQKRELRDQTWTKGINAKEVRRYGSTLKQAAGAPAPRQKVLPAPGYGRNSGQDRDPDFAGPYGNCSRFGTGYACTQPGGGVTNCTRFGNGYHCSQVGGPSEICNPHGGGYQCSGPGGVSNCSQFGGGYQCTQPGGGTRTCTPFGAGYSCQ